MATTTLRPGSDISQGVVTGSAPGTRGGSVPPYYDDFNQDPDSGQPDAAALYNAGASSADLVVGLSFDGGEPGDFDKPTAVEVRAYVEAAGTRTNDDVDLLVNITNASGTSIIVGGEQRLTIWNGAFTNGIKTFSPSPTAGSTKADWQTARMSVRWAYTKNQGPDNIDLDVHAIEANLTYTPSAPAYSGSGSASHTSAATGSGRKNGQGTGSATHVSATTGSGAGARSGSGSTSHASATSGSGTQPPAYEYDTAHVNVAASSITFDKPPSTVAGDLLVVWISHESASTTWTPPSGWTQFNSNLANTTNNASAWQRVAGASEPSTYTWDYATANEASGAIVRIPQASVADSALTADANGNLELAVTPGAAGDVLVMFGGHEKSGATAGQWSHPSGTVQLTKLFDEVNPSGGPLAIACFVGTAASTALHTEEIDHALDTSQGQGLLVAATPAGNDKSGSGSATHVSAVTGSGTKAASGSGSATHVSAVTGSGTKAASGSGSATHVSAVTGSGTKAASGSGSATHVSAVTGSGAHTAAGAGTSSAVSSVTGSGTKAATGSGSDTRVSAVVAAGIKAASGSGSASHVSAATGSGERGAENYSGSGSTSHASATSGAGTAVEWAIFGFPGPAVPTVDTDHKVRVRASGSGSMRVELRQGTTLIEGWTQALGALTTYVFDVQELNAANISDYDALYVAVIEVAPVTTPSLQVTWVQLELPASANFSGSGSTSHVSTVTGSGTKAVTGSGSDTRVSDVAGSGHKAATGLTSLSAVSAATGSGTSARSGSGSTSHVSAASGSGTASEARSGSGSTSHVSAVTGSGVKATDGAGTAAHASAAVGSGASARSGSGSTSHVSGVSGSGTGTEARSGSGSTSHVSAVTGTGGSARSGSGSTSHVSAISGSGALGVSGSGSMSATSSTSGAGTKATSGTGSASHVSAVSGYGSAPGSGVVHIEHTHAVTGTGTSTRNGAGSVSHVSTVSGSGSASEGHAGSGSASHTSTVSGTGRKGAHSTGTLTATTDVSGSGIAGRSGSGFLSATSDSSGSGQHDGTTTGTTGHTSVTSGAGTSTRSGSGATTATSATSGAGLAGGAFNFTFEAGWPRAAWKVRLEPTWSASLERTWTAGGPRL